MSSSLVLVNVTMEEKGVYRCKAEVEPTKHLSASAKVIVYGEYTLNVLLRRVILQ